MKEIAYHIEIQSITTDSGKNIPPTYRIPAFGSLQRAKDSLKEWPIDKGMKGRIIKISKVITTEVMEEL